MIPFASPDLTGNELKYVADCIESGWISARGKYVRQFEESFGAWCGSNAISCSSGTAALHLALLASNIGLGDEVIVPDLTYGATASVVRAVGGKVVLCDVDHTGCLSPEALRGVFTSNTRAVIPVHLYGNEADMPAIHEVVGDNAVIIEDACEAVDVERTGDFAAYSFFPNKHITTGEGGMLTGKKLDMARLYRDGGRVGDAFFHEVPGLNYRMTNMQAALGCAQMERIDELCERRQVVVERYLDTIIGWGSWVFVAEGRMELDGIETRPVFTPLHRQPPFSNWRNFPVSDDLYENGTCLPTHVNLSDNEIDFIVESVRRKQDGLR